MSEADRLLEVIHAEAHAVETWGWRDSRTGQRWSASVVRTREQAEGELAEWRARDKRGKRPDLHADLPFVEVFRLGPDEF